MGGLGPLMKGRPLARLVGGPAQPSLAAHDEWAVLTYGSEQPCILANHITWSGASGIHQLAARSASMETLLSNYFSVCDAHILYYLGPSYDLVLSRYSTRWYNCSSRI